MSSIMTSTPGRPSSSCSMLSLTISGALVISNGILRKQYRPKGVMKVVNFELPGSKGTFKNPLETSSFTFNAIPIAISVFLASVSPRLSGNLLSLPVSHLPFCLHDQFLIRTCMVM